MLVAGFRALCLNLWVRPSRSLRDVQHANKVYSAAITTLSDTARTYSDYSGPRGGVAA